MSRFRSIVSGSALTAIVLAVPSVSCSGPTSTPPEQASSATEPGTPPAAAGGAPAGAETAAERDFIRVNLDEAVWNVTEGNTLGVQTAVFEGDPSKAGFYLTVNRFPPGVMSRPHYHPDERYGLVLKGTWYTGTSDEFTPEETVGLKPGDYMRHPAGATHFDGALDEEVLVAIAGYGPTAATVVDGGEIFGRSRPAN